MALLDGYYPANGHLILSPTNYTTGGTDLGKLGSIQMIEVNHDFEFVTQHVSGSTVTGTRVTGTQATLMVHLEEFGDELIELVNNNVSDGSDFDDYTGYNVGDFFDSNQYSKLQVRPLDTDDSTVVSDKPHVYIPRGVCMRGFNPVYGRRSKVTDGFVLLIKAVLDADNYNVPVLFGDPNTLPAIA